MADSDHESSDEGQDSMNPRGKNKAAPFTQIETSILLDLIREKKDIIESKKTDFGTTGKKQKEWERIADKFNCQPSCTKKSSKQLKTHWENKKKKAKVDVSKNQNLVYIP
jgi:Myb/SANT-like DNA-binding domain